MKRLLLPILAALLVAAHCSDEGWDDLPPRPQPVDAGTPDDCARACQHLRELGCREGGETPGGASCEDVCNNVEGSSTVTVDPKCLADVPSCSALDTCTYGE